MSESRILKIVITSSVCVLLVVVGYAIYVKKSQAVARQQRLTALQKTIDATIAQSHQLISEQEFDEAKGVLRNLEARIESEGAWELREAIAEAVQHVHGVESDYKEKIKQGYVYFEGRFMHKSERDRTLARRKVERERQAAEASARTEAERRRLAEAREKARLKREKERAKQMLATALSNLPSVKSQLDATYARDRGSWVLWLLSWELRSMGGKPDRDPEEIEISQERVIASLRGQTAESSPTLTAYRDDIIGLLRSLGYPKYIAYERDVPVSFALDSDKPVLLIGSVASDTVYNNINQSLNTAKKRAANFMQRTIIPDLLKSRLSKRLRAAKLEYFGVVYVYGHRNFVNEEHGGLPESLCIVMATRDYIMFVEGKLTQEALLRGSSVFLASDGPAFVKVELELE